ncbi:MAG: MEKHLA domain-containing protein [Nitrospira sp.]
MPDRRVASGLLLDAMLQWDRQGNTPIWMNPPVLRWSQQLLNSFRHWMGRELITRSGSSLRDAEILFTAPFVVVSHGNEPDPILNYGNHAALRLWAMEWDQFTRTPSRMTAEPVHREERRRILERAQARGYVEGYRGVRISATNHRFLVIDAILWNVLDDQGCYLGQAAMFQQWEEVC